MNEYLVQREQKQFKIDDLLTRYPIVVSIKANIPGNQKQIKEAYFLVSLFSKLLHQHYHPMIEFTDDSTDGPYTLFGLSQTDSNKLKNGIILIENQHPLGRFVDIDIFDCNQKGSKRRSDLGLISTNIFMKPFFMPSIKNFLWIINLALLRFLLKDHIQT